MLLLLAHVLSVIADLTSLLEPRIYNYLEK